MKKLVSFVILLLVLNIHSYPQRISTWLQFFSETEITNYKTSRKFSPLTMEDYCDNFIKKYNKESLIEIFKLIELGEVEIQNFQNRQTNLIYVQNIELLRKAIRERLAFVRDGNLYILTYEPANITSDKKNYDCGTDNICFVNSKNLYLYCRDINGWKKASNLIRKDFWIEDSESYETRAFLSNTHFSTRTDIGEIIGNAQNEMILMMVPTEIYYSGPKRPYENYRYTPILVMFPSNISNFYEFYYFEPYEKIDKNGMNINSFNCDNNSIKINFKNNRYLKITLIDGGIINEGIPLILKK